MLRIASTLALVALASSTSAQDLWILDAAGGPGADFIALSDAIAGAGEGDVILIRPGSYSAGTIDDKGLVLLGDGTGTVSIHTLTVTGLAPGGRLVARELHVSGGFLLQDCAGAVWIEDCTVGVSFFWAGIRIEQCGDVVLSRCATIPIGDPSGAAVAGCATCSDRRRARWNAVSARGGQRARCDREPWIHAGTERWQDVAEWGRFQHK